MLQADAADQQAQKVPGGQGCDRAGQTQPQNLRTVNFIPKEAAAAQATQKQAAANLEESLEAMLRQHGIADAQAEAEMYISGDNCIEIEQVTVYCTDPAAAEPLLTDCLGKEVKIHVETAS